MPADDLARYHGLLHRKSEVIFQNMEQADKDSVADILFRFPHLTYPIPEPKSKP